MIEFIENGCTLQTSGTTGRPKTIHQSPSKIVAANSIAREVQKITDKSRILTVCSLKHAGGLLAQTLPGIECGASVTIEPYNPYAWVKQIECYTHSHLTPRMAEAIIKTKTFNKLNLSGITITCGSDPVSAKIINKFTGQGATFITNWGMTEIGPVAINKTYSPGDVAVDHPFGYTVLGDNFGCDWRIENEELWVHGDICTYNGWFATGDRVYCDDHILYFIGRIE